MHHNQKFISDEHREEARQVIYDVPEMYLDGNDWIAGDTMTIADFHYISSIATIKVRSLELLY